MVQIQTRFSGFRSRWMIPRLCICESPSRTSTHLKGLGLIGFKGNQLHCYVQGGTVILHIDCICIYKYVYLCSYLAFWEAFVQAVLVVTTSGRPLKPREDLIAALAPDSRPIPSCQSLCRTPKSHRSLLIGSCFRKMWPWIYIITHAFSKYCADDPIPFYAPNLTCGTLHLQA